MRVPGHVVIRQLAAFPAHGPADRRPAPASPGPAGRPVPCQSAGHGQRPRLSDPAADRAGLPGRPGARRVLPEAARPGVPLRRRTAGRRRARPAGSRLVGAQRLHRAPAGVPAGRRARPGDLAGRPAPADAAPGPDRPVGRRTGSAARAGADARRADAARSQRRSGGTAAGLRRSGRASVLHLRGADPDLPHTFPAGPAAPQPADTSPAADPRTIQRWANSASVSGSGPSTTSAVPNSAMPSSTSSAPARTSSRPDRPPLRLAESLSRTVFRHPSSRVGCVENRLFRHYAEQDYAGPIR